MNRVKRATEASLAPRARLGPKENRCVRWRSPAAPLSPELRAIVIFRVQSPRLSHADSGHVQSSGHVAPQPCPGCGQVAALLPWWPRRRRDSEVCRLHPPTNVQEHVTSSPPGGHCVTAPVSLCGGAGALCVLATLPGRPLQALWSHCSSLQFIVPGNPPQRHPRQGFTPCHCEPLGCGRRRAGGEGPGAWAG